MGYYTYFSGDLTITPIPPKPAPSATEFGQTTYFEYFCFEEIDDGSEDVAVVDGEIKVVGKARNHLNVTQASEESMKAYNYSEQLQALIDWASSQGCAVDGVIYCDGEESGDFSRYRVENSVVHGETPRFVWPNGDITNL